MRAHEDRHPALAHPAEDVLDQARAARIETHHRFVDDHGVRAVEKGGAHHETLLHAVGKALGQLVFPASKLEELEHFAHAPANLVSVQPVQSAVEAQELAGGQLFVDERTVRDEAERCFCADRIGRQVEAVDENPAGGRLSDAGSCGIESKQK